MTQPTPEQQQLLAQLVESATSELRSGATPATVLDRLVQRGLSEELARRVLDRARSDSGESSGELRAISDLNRHVFIARLPANADPSEIVAAPSMGTRQDVIAHIQHVLPGLSFDANGRGRFEKGGFALEFELGADDVVSLIDLEISGGGGALSAIKRLSHRTGWRVLDRSHDHLFDLPGGEAHLDPEPPPPPPPKPAPPPTTRRLAPRAAAPAKSRLVPILIGVGVAAAVAIAIAFALVPRGIEANEARAADDVVEFARASQALALVNMGAFVEPETLDDPSRYATLLSTGSPLGGLSDRSFGNPVRAGYRFEFRPAAGSLASGAIVQPAFTRFVYLALPEVPGQTGRRSFAYFSDARTVFARDDGTPPTPADRAIARLD